MDRLPLILIVEDNQDNLDLLCFILGELNVSLLSTKEGIMAVDLAQTQEPDLILLDMMLPDISGMEVISRLKQNPKTATIPIIAVTAMAMSGDRDSAMQAGANDYITKPYNIESLLVLIHHYLIKTHSVMLPWE
jgi:CheY-like chemotaxis protein